MKLAICDDDPVQRDYAARTAERELADLAPEIRCFPGAQPLLREIREKGWTPQIAVLDIELPGESGIDLARELNRLAPDCRVIYLTAYPERAPEAYETEHVWFVLKSRAEEFLPAALRRALTQSGIGPARGLLLRTRGETRLLPLEEILYLSREGRRAQIVTETGVFYSSRRPAELIPAELEKAFVRCHQGYWVNLEKIRLLDRNEFVLSDSRRVPISRVFRAAARESFFRRVRGEEP
ncbi:MAG: response regulator transcription factor [Oscillospiraceae bacterium]|nr:response regulator transcription factor [Oscillospiraceae bacterium]